jgi:hypothetical protein
VGRIVRLAFPQCSVVNAQPLTDELRNANFRLRPESTPEFIVLRIYEHDASLCQKELDLPCLLAGTVPVPEVLHAAPCGWEGIPPFVLMRYASAAASAGIRPKSSADGVDNAQPFSPMKALALLSTLQSADIVLPTTDGREIRLRRITEPTAEQKSRLHWLGRSRPERLKSTAKCSADFATA